VVFPQRLHGTIGLDLVVAIAEDPRSALAILTLRHLGMLNSCLHAQASSQHVKTSVSEQHHSSPVL